MCVFSVQLWVLFAIDFVVVDIESQVSYVVFRRNLLRLEKVEAYQSFMRFVGPFLYEEAISKTRFCQIARTCAWGAL